MKLNILFLLFFNTFLFSQIIKDSVQILPEHDLEKKNLETINNYRKKLNKSKLNLFYDIEFNGAFYHKNNDSTNFSGKARYKKDLLLKNIYFNQNISKEDKIALQKFFNQLYSLAYTYYSLSQDKDDILNDFYSTQSGNNDWNFRIYKKKTKEKLNTNVFNKMIFKITLDNNGKVQKILTLSDTTHGFPKNGKIPLSHYIDINFNSFDKENKINSIKGYVIIPTNNNKITFTVYFL